MLIRIFLAALALCFAIFGTWSILDPAAMGDSLGVTFTGDNGIYEARGIYGGVSLGAALLLLSGAIRERMMRPALWFISAYMGGYSFARLAGLIAGDQPTTDFILFAVFEAVCMVVSIIALSAYKPK
ncbi:DUF4345 family protein [Hyphomonas pacifica]|uniref:Uncharacterized protein n=1 Tax=Hyphomonas pacifica TaxID=1280941 RepID=A0A062TNJ1_9PROT|nr:DUF4345 family protein [Hyphomonas pacifica]KCZ46806.1 hypothetical protein HY2_05300 [Hyphomonas pacifica]RAN30422.1 hypothetical protein HY3_06270 [Hyphomonas pacifica]RAN31810.1 hypothetical protein HY11_06370 [Hyphomonas pacifica]